MTLEQFFKQNPKVALAFSGGTDSSLLLYMAAKFNANIKAYFVKTALQPQFELDDAIALANQFNVELKILYPDILKNQDVVRNDKMRCYYCKKANFSLIKEEAKKDGYSILIDGNNASDDITDRPGMVACQELSVLSPLRMCGIDKNAVRELSKQAGLFTCNKPSYSCLATRIQTAFPLNEDVLKAVELCEDYMRQLGFLNFRIRIIENTAIIVLKDAQFDLVLDNKNNIVSFLSKYFNRVLLDLKEG